MSIWFISRYFQYSNVRVSYYRISPDLKDRAYTNVSHSVSKQDFKIKGEPNEACFQKGRFIAFNRTETSKRAMETTHQQYPIAEGEQWYWDPSWWPSKRSLLRSAFAHRHTQTHTVSHTGNKNWPWRLKKLAISHLLGLPPLLICSHGCFS